MAVGLCHSLKTQGEIESEVRNGLVEFQREFIGKGPKEIRVHLVGSCLVVVLQEALTCAEKNLASAGGRELLKQVRGHMIFSGRSKLLGIVEKATGVGLVSVHHDVSTVTGEEMIIFSLDGEPAFRKRKGGEC